MISLEERTIIAGRYRLERALARGGMGSVWVARHILLDVDVALKFISSIGELSVEARERFEREAKASAQIKSPYVVHMYDYGIEDGTPYLAMELLEGEDLKTRLRRLGRLTPAATLSLVTQICKALRLAHEVGLVHRDLKPGNIFFARHADEEIVKVLDFGIAKATKMDTGSGTKTGALMGSPHYMSPEQVRRSKSVDHRTDLWAVGVVIFRCLTGRLPFPGDEVGDVLVELCTENIPVPSQIAPDLSPEIDAFLFRALARDPSRRFQSAREMSDAFAAVVGPAGGHPEPPPFLPADVVSPTPGPWDLTSRQANTLAGNSFAALPGRRRRKNLIALGGAISGGALLAGLVVLLLRAAPTPPPSQTAALTGASLPLPAPSAAPSTSATPPTEAIAVSSLPDVPAPAAATRANASASLPAVSRPAVRPSSVRPKTSRAGDPLDDP